jgi:hypothetical protein
MDPEFWHFSSRRLRPDFRLFVRSLINPQAYDPQAIWALFWALAKAEHEFLYRYIPFWSHEERLTGHLVSQMVERLEEFHPHWRVLTASDHESKCEIWYADTATARRESVTGADLGLVVHARFPNQEEFFKVARFQAKKADRSGKAAIDLNQVEALLRTAHLGYLLFYHPLDPKQWSLPPTVRPAATFSNEVQNARKNSDEPPHHRPRPGDLPSISVDTQGNGWDLAAFVTFALTDPGSEEGVLATTAEDAVGELMAHTVAPLPSPSRILVVTVGAGTSTVHWPGLFREYIGSGQE